MSDRRHWFQLCSSMDIIGDTDLAVEAYLSTPTAKREDGELYLRAYGLLQVLFVQQDALKHAAEAIGLPYTSPEPFNAIRDVRNDAVGHPTKRGGSRSESFGIVRISLSHEGFTLYSFDIERQDNFRSVRLLDLINVQRVAVLDVIERMIAHLGSSQEAESDGTPDTGRANAEHLTG